MLRTREYFHPRRLGHANLFVTNLDHEIVDALARKVSLSINAKNYFRKDGDYNFLMREIQGAIAS